MTVRYCTPLLVASVSTALVAGAAHSAPVPVSPAGAVSVPALEVPSSPLYSEAGNAARVDHIMLKRALKGQPTEALYRGLFGPGLARSQAQFAVTAHKDTIAGVPVMVYEPRAGVGAANRDHLLVNVHGGGFQACFLECGGMESIPMAALTGLKVISIDYREGPGHHYPEGLLDVEAVYREILKTYRPQHVALYGCSAGGMLTVQSLAHFAQHNLPMPAAAGVFCSGGDPTMRGDSTIIGNLLGDGEAPEPGPRRGGEGLEYMATAAKDDPEAYPARAPALLAKFPPTLVVTGTRDFAMSSAVNLHSRLVAAGVDARLHVWEGGRHAFFYDVRVPEAHEAYKVMAKFFTDRLR
jgi:acetyl esterase/lipase